MELRFTSRCGARVDGEVVIPSASSVGRGRVTLPAAFTVPLSRCVSVVAGLRSACWIGTDREDEPDVGRLTYRAEACVDGRGRLVLERRVRGFLGVADPDRFDAVIAVLSAGSVLVVPAEEFDARLARVRLP